MFQLVMVCGQRQAVIGFFRSAYRAGVVTTALEWDEAWTPELPWITF